MRLVLAVLALCSCRSAPPVAVENRGGTARASCALLNRIERDARRYAGSEPEDLGFHTWSEWRIGLQLVEQRPDGRVRGTLAMVGDDLTWTFDVAGTFDPDTCQLELLAGLRGPLQLDLAIAADGSASGRITTRDDTWLVGPPFPVTAPR